MKKNSFINPVLMFVFLITGCGFNESENRGGEEEKMEILPARYSTYKGSPEIWRSVLQCWDSEIKLALPSHIPFLFVAAPTKKLDLELPPSYRDFVAAGGLGFKRLYDYQYPHEDYPKPFLDLEAVQLFSGRSPQDHDMWTSVSQGSDDPLGKAYFSYDKKGSRLYRMSELSAMLAVGEEPNGGFYLLNPLHKTVDGEWEAMLLHPKIPGAIRFKSFAHLVAHIYLEDHGIIHKLGGEQQHLYYFTGEWRDTCLSRIIEKDW